MAARYGHCWLPGWLEKYGPAIDARFSSPEKFAERFSVPVLVHLTRIRGF